MPDHPAQPVQPEHRELLRQALADAVHYRDPPLRCVTCQIQGGLCAQCSAGLSLARAYLALSRQLGLTEHR
jgi:hypothetical protein